MDGIAPLFKAKRISCSFCVGNTGNFMLILRWIILEVAGEEEKQIELNYPSVASLRPVWFAVERWFGLLWNGGLV
jgi:hypothetical protein